MYQCETISILSGGVGTSGLVNSRLMSSSEATGPVAISDNGEYLLSAPKRPVCV